MIPKSKFGTCSQCGDEVPCAKVGKELFCIAVCHRNNKAKAQIKRANEKVSVRSLGTYQRQEGIVDSIQELTIDLDRVVSRYIRLRDLQDDGFIHCYICGRPITFEKAQSMHYVKCTHKATRWLVQNLKAGCWECNNTNDGNLAEYKVKLEQEQAGITDWLEEQKDNVVNTTRTELKELLSHFQQKVRMLEFKLK